MAKVIFTPWKYTSDLLVVRNQFYPAPDYEGPDLRERACATVSAWKLRGNLPHPVEATALLTDAILHDDARKNSVFSIRATYAAAFCRFVTGLVDSKLGARRSMFSRAVELGLPASFVELRHEATHRELPSLTVLRGAVGRSLEWLWGFYWAGISSTGSTGVGSGPGGLQSVEGEKEEIRSLLEQARALIEPGSKDTSGSGSEPPRKKRRVQQEVASVAARAISISRGSQDATGLIAWEMLQGGVLIPGGRKFNDPLAESIAKWDPFLQQISEGHPSFLVTLTEKMADELAFSPSSLSNTNDEKKEKSPHHEAVYTWLDHILQSAQWESQRRLISLSYIKAACEEVNNEWTKLLKRSLGKREDVLPAPVQQQKESRTIPPSAKPDSLPIDEDMKVLSKFGWAQADTLDTRQAGMV